MAGPFNSAFSFLIVVQVGLILKDIHERGFIYRDIKASNFMIDASGRVTMIDLGHAKHIKNSKTLTICGTTHSMPP
jgi:serine/threonine protein kinase